MYSIDFGVNLLHWRIHIHQTDRVLALYQFGAFWEVLRQMRPNSYWIAFVNYEMYEIYYHNGQEEG